MGSVRRTDFSIGLILEHYGVDLARTDPDRGGWQKVRCFLHDDRNPSAAVNYEANRFLCYAGCTDYRGEDGIGLVQLVEGYPSLSSAIEEASRITGASDRGVSESDHYRGCDLLADAWDW